MRSLSWVVYSICLAVMGCGFSDEDRCISGQVYVLELQACRDPKVAPAGTAQFGESCTADAQCGPGAPYCGIKPGESAGKCTIRDCAGGSCPAGYLCCDCAAVSPGMPPVCTSEDEQLAITYCVCQ